MNDWEESVEKINRALGEQEKVINIVQFSLQRCIAQWKVCIVCVEEMKHFQVRENRLQHR